jgi:hypothetical protein
MSHFTRRFSLQTDSRQPGHASSSPSSSLVSSSLRVAAILIVLSAFDFVEPASDDARSLHSPRLAVVMAADLVDLLSAFFVDLPLVWGFVFLSVLWFISNSVLTLSQEAHKNRSYVVLCTVLSQRDSGHGPFGMIWQSFTLIGHRCLLSRSARYYYLRIS